MQLHHIAVFIVAALLYAAFAPPRWRGWLLLVGSVVALYWLQATLTIRYLDFALPTATLVLTVAMWWVTRPNDTVEPVGARHAVPLQPLSKRWAFLGTVNRDDWLTLLVITALVLALAATRYLVPELRPTASRAPDVLPVALALLLVGAALLALWRTFGQRRGLLTGGILFMVVLFVLLKTPPFSAGMAAALRGLSGQPVELASPVDLEWLGFSYVAFRLIHTLRERQMGKLPALSLREYVTYVIFFPAITAGPIDRAERFVKDERAITEYQDISGRGDLVGHPCNRMRLFTAPRLVQAGGRISLGLFKKFVIADSLALVALNSTNAGQAQTTGALWLLLYAYAFRLFFDFSGYTDIAIGIGILCGFKLPKNFDRPYLKNNLAAFWQSWHMTLSNWVRFYVFSPLSRALLKRKVDSQTAVFLAQMTTMLVIGLWHGVTLGFAVWGLWHGLGLFAHKTWSDRTRKWFLRLNAQPRLKTVWTLAGVLLTFHFVLLGWVWFALPVESAWRVFLGLFGIRI
ncbi:MAG: MBOAT family protein [Chloroflexi bacterium]|nr:MBOAT family protein [Chloroflexota bacterium]